MGRPLGPSAVPNGPNTPSWSPVNIPLAQSAKSGFLLVNVVDVNVAVLLPSKSTAVHSKYCLSGDDIYDEIDMSVWLSKLIKLLWIRRRRRRTVFT